MSTYIICYDLDKPGPRHDSLLQHLKSYPHWTRPLENVWVLVTPMSAREIISAINDYTDINDRVLVVRSAGQGAWRHLGSAPADWLQQHL